MASTHITLGFSSYILLQSMISKSNIFPLSDFSIPGLIEIFFLFLGCVIVDIDHPKSYVGNKLSFLSIPISSIFGHRGITHSMVGLLVFITIIYFLSGYFTSYQSHATFAFMIGYVAHLLADYSTNSGIPILWPLKAKFVSPFVMKTGSSSEHFFSMGALFVMLIFLFV